MWKWKEAKNCIYKRNNINTCVFLHTKLTDLLSCTVAVTNVTFYLKQPF